MQLVKDDRADSYCSFLVGWDTSDLGPPRLSVFLPSYEENLLYEKLHYKTLTIHVDVDPVPCLHDSMTLEYFKHFLQ